MKRMTVSETTLQKIKTAFVKQKAFRCAGFEVECDHKNNQIFLWARTKSDVTCVAKYHFGSCVAVFPACYGWFYTSDRACLCNTLLVGLGLGVTVFSESANDVGSLKFKKKDGAIFAQTVRGGEKFKLDFTNKFLERFDYGAQIKEGFLEEENKTKSHRDHRIVITDKQAEDIATQIAYGGGRVTIGEINIVHYVGTVSEKDTYISAYDAKTNHNLCTYSKIGKWINSQAYQGLTDFARMRLLNAFLKGLNWGYSLCRTSEDGWEGYRLGMQDSIYPIAANIDASGAICLDGRQDKLFFAGYKDGVAVSTECELFFK